MKIKLVMILGALMLLSSCSNDKPIFKVDIVEENGNKVQYVPNMPFESLNDSAYYYFSKEDYKKVMGAEILKGKEIYKSDKFRMRVILRKYTQVERNSFEFVLRTFSKDFKIIDSYIMASTAGNLNCNGVINGDLEIITTCADGAQTITTVNEYGKFITNE